MHNNAQLIVIIVLKRRLITWLSAIWSNQQFFILLIKEVGESGGFGAKKWQKWELIQIQIAIMPFKVIY